MKHYCYGIAHKDGRLLISDNAQTVYIYDLNGQEQKRISKDGSGKDIFQRNQHIAVSATEDKVFVADSNKGVVALDSQGNYLSTLSNNSLSCGTGVCTDGRNVFVSGNQSNNIIQFGQDFKMLGETGKVTSPLSLCFDQQRKQLIVTHYNNNNITILELE
jgi:DNA-binding beta-propeller fold protein YncE